MHTSNPFGRIRFGALLLSGSVFVSTSVAQTVAPAQASDPATEKAQNVVEKIPATNSGEEEIWLSPFQVDASDDHGYVATSALVATGFSKEIYKTPININVITSEFFKDKNLTDIAQVGDYLSSVSVNRQGSGNQGDGATFQIRGFGTLWNTRNGVRRYSFAGGLENVDRVEAIKGPLTVFFGQQSPGGIVNYVTKRPAFKKESEINFRVGSYQQKYGSISSQGPVTTNNTLAYRIFASKDDSKDWRDYTFNKRTFLYGGLLWQPTKKLQFYAEYEHVDQAFNGAGNVPFGNKKYLEDWATPPQAVKDWAIATGAHSNEQDNQSFAPDQIANSENVIGVLRDRWRKNNSTWANDIKSATGVAPNLISGSLEDLYPSGRKWNVGGKNGIDYNVVDTYTAEVNFEVNEYFSLRGYYVRDDTSRNGYYSIVDQPMGDGNFQPVNWGIRNPNNSQLTRLEMLTRFKVGKSNHSIVTGLEVYEDEWRPEGAWMGNPEVYLPNSQVPYSDGYTGGAPRPQNPGEYLDLGWDPRTTPTFDGLMFFPNGRLPEYGNEEYTNVQRNRRRGLYANWTGSFFSDRLTTLLGVRNEHFTNEPWPFGAINTEGTIPTAGAVFEFAKGYTAFASYSKSYEPNWSGASVTGPGATPAELAEKSKPNKGSGFDIGIKASTPNGKISGAFTYYEVRRAAGYVADLEAIAADPRNNDGNPQNNVVIRNFGGTIMGRGLELDAVFNPTKNYTFTLSYSFMPTAQITKASTESEIPRVGLRTGNAPKHDFSTWHKYSFSEGMLKGVSIGAGVHGHSSTTKSNDPSESNIVLKGYWLVDAMVGYQFKGYHDLPSTVNLNVSNLLNDQKYYYNWLIPGDPLKITLSASMRF